MDQSTKPHDARGSRPAADGIDFEATDIEDARRVLDDESLVQFEVAVADSPAHWKRRRRPTVPTDRALSGRAIEWLLALPDGLRPQRLSARFPRIANALAEIWDDPARCQEVLGKLLNDGRKGRAGFPRDVHAELIALRDWTQMF